MYHIFLDNNYDEKTGRIPVYIPKHPKDFFDETKVLAGIAMTELGLKQFFSDVWWGEGRIEKSRSFYLGKTSGINEEQAFELEEILAKETDHRHKIGMPEKEVMEKRKSRKGESR